MTIQVNEFPLTNMLFNDANIHIKDTDGFDKRIG